MGLFSKKPREDAPAPTGPVVVSSTFVEARDTGAHIHATLLSERYTEREALAIESDLLGVAPQRSHRLLVDMSRVLLLASAGIGSLIQVHKACNAAGGKLVLYNIDEQVRMMLAVAKLDRLLAMADSPADATKRLG